MQNKFQVELLATSDVVVLRGRIAPMRNHDDNVPCERCTSRTKFAMQTSAFGTHAGFRIYQCVECSELTWVSAEGQVRITPPRG